MTYVKRLPQFKGTDVRTKKCSHCKQVKLAKEFYKDANTVSKLQAYCIECKTLAQQERLAGKVTPRLVKKHIKMMKIAKGMAQGKSLEESYMELGTTKSLVKAKSAADSFLTDLDGTELEVFRRMLTTPVILISVQEFFTNVLTRKIDTTVEEYLKTLLGWGKFAGTFAPEKVETINRTEMIDKKEQLLEEVNDFLKKQKGETDETKEEKTEEAEGIARIDLPIQDRDSEGGGRLHDRTSDMPDRKSNGG